MKSGVELIAEERKEQIEKHGFGASHDKLNGLGQLRSAASFLLTRNPDHFPADWPKKFLDKFIKKNEMESLVVAGALIAAEIDRLTALQPLGTLK